MMGLEKSMKGLLAPSAFEGTCTHVISVSTVVIYHREPAPDILDVFEPIELVGLQLRIEFELTQLVSCGNSNQPQLV